LFEEFADGWDYEWREDWRNIVLRATGKPLNPAQFVSRRYFKPLTSIGAYARVTQQEHSFM
jgi:hypothetical protein